MFNTITGTFDIDKSGSYILAVFKGMIHFQESKILQSVGPAGRLSNSKRTQMRCANNDSSSGFSGLFSALIPFLSEPSLFMVSQTRLILLALFIIIVSVKDRRTVNGTLDGSVTTTPLITSLCLRFLMLHHLLYLKNILQ